MLNRDPRKRVPVSLTLSTALTAALHAAELTDGLVDPTLAGEMEAAGYRTTIEDPADLRQALACAPPRRPARGRDTWHHVHALAGYVVRPPGVQLDLGGTAKGLLADKLSARAVAVDCAGDMRIRSEQPVPVDVIHPLTGDPVARLQLRDGGIATSGIDRRSWHDADGCFAHHLLDPSTGRPAWTGLVGATALAPTALEAEARAKAALLSGPEGARRWLAAHGGFLFHDDGEVERV
jgi:thiamine biosynthesis lipoprotein